MLQLVHCRSGHADAANVCCVPFSWDVVWFFLFGVLLVWCSSCLRTLSWILFFQKIAVMEMIIRTVKQQFKIHMQSGE